MEGQGIGIDSGGRRWGSVGKAGVLVSKRSLSAKLSQSIGGRREPGEDEALSECSKKLRTIDVNVDCHKLENYCVLFNCIVPDHWNINVVAAFPG